MSARQAVVELTTAWQAAVRYRKVLAADGGVSAIRPHLEDMDTFGVIVEMAEEGLLIGDPEEIMERIIVEERRLPLGYPLYDPAQEIYEAAIALLTDMSVLKEPT